MTQAEKDAILAEGAAEEAKETANVTFEESIKALSDKEKTAKRTERETAEGDKVNVDYKKISQAEKLRREKAEQALSDENFKDRERKRKEKEAAEKADGEDKPLTRAEAKALLKKTTDESSAREIAKRLTGDDVETEAVLEFWKATPLTQFKTLEEQLKFVVGGLSSGKLLAKNEELKRALKGTASIRQGGINGVKVDVGADEPEMPGQERQALADSGFTWDPALKLYKKALAGSKKVLYHDPVKKKRFTK